jgi:MoaA/NifB/PqqE/SkfB family radical SAM enzyme
MDGFSPKPIPLREVRIETTNRCTYSCLFCPRDRMHRSKGTMTVEDLLFAAERIEEYTGRFFGQVHLSGYGEPLLDNDLPAKIAAIAGKWPDCEPFISTTLGINVGMSWLRNMCESGLKTIEVSMYGHNPAAYREITGRDTFSLSKDNLRSLVAISATLPEPLHIVVKTHMDGVAEFIDSDPYEGLDELVAEFGTEWVEYLNDRGLHNYGKARCYRPAKTTACSILGGCRASILQVTWDLKVIPCCFDFDASMILGDLRELSLHSILHGEVLDRLRQAHQDGNLHDYPICMECCTR